MPSDGTPEPRPGRLDLYDLADSIAIDLAVDEPDWCAVARDSERLTRHLQERCQDERNG